MFYFVPYGLVDPWHLWDSETKEEIVEDRKAEYEREAREMLRNSPDPDIRNTMAERDAIRARLGYPRD